eukprot:1214666-Rhodomonas_salina.1
MSGTDIAYAGFCLLTRDAMSGTDLAYAAMRPTSAWRCWRRGRGRSRGGGRRRGGEGQSRQKRRCCLQNWRRHRRKWRGGHQKRREQQY